MVEIQNYKEFITEFIRKQMIIFGPNVARDIAHRVAGIKVDLTGEVLEITGSPPLVLQDLVREYQRLSGPVTVLNLSLLFEHHPDIKAEFSPPLPRIKLVCALIDDEA